MKLFSAVLLGLSLSTSLHGAENLIGFDKNELESDEAGLWMAVEKQEQELRTASVNIDDPELLDPIKGILCDLLGEGCSYIRPYVLRSAGFNAFMMPNGAMFINSGLLLRMASFDELAAVLGHEASHYFNNHSISRLRSVYRTQNGFAVLGALVSAASAVSVNTASSYESMARNLDLSNTAVAMLQTAQIVATLQLLDYSREQETDADLDGNRWMHSANYNSNAAADIWEKVIEEQAAGGSEAGFSLLSTHPAPPQRVSDLRRQARQLQINETRGESADQYLNLIARYREDWISDELHVLDTAQFAHVVSKQVDLGFPIAKAHYFEGLAYLRAASNERNSRRKTELTENAIIAINTSIRSEGSTDLPPGIHRDLGGAYEDMENIEAARRAFNKYLELSPNAWDARFIQRKLDGW